MKKRNKTDSQDTDSSKGLRKQTIFDDIFRMMVEKMPFLLIPLVNEVFGTDYSEDEPVVQSRNEHTEKPNGRFSGKRITDSRFRIGQKYYHIECQSKLDHTMAARMYRYDAVHSTEDIIGSRKLIADHIQYPYSCVLYVRNHQSLPDYLEMPIYYMWEQQVIYKVPVVRAQDYDIDQIFSNNLLILLPYYILRYESALQNPIPNPKKMAQVLEDFNIIADRLDTYYAHTEQSQWLLDLVGLILDLVKYIIPGSNDVKGKVVAIMRGTNLMLLSEQCEKKGRLEHAEETVLNLYRLDMPIETIARANNVSETQVHSWLEKAGLLKCSAV